MSSASAKRFFTGKVEKGRNIAKGYRHALYQFELSDHNSTCVKCSEKFQSEASSLCRQTFMTIFTAVQHKSSHDQRSSLLLAPRVAPGLLFDDFMIWRSVSDLTICHPDLTICRSDLTEVICRPDLTIRWSVARISPICRRDRIICRPDLTTCRPDLAICSDLMRTIKEQFSQFCVWNLRNGHRLVARRASPNYSITIQLTSAHSASVWTYQLLIEAW